MVRKYIRWRVSDGNLGGVKVDSVGISGIFNESGIVETNFAGRRKQTAGMIAKAIFKPLNSYGRVGAQFVGLAQIFFPRRVHIEQGYERHFRERFELNVVAEGDHHRV